ncbi:hypothetical protein CEY17_00625 [Corynebacterium glutamicum ATCC 14067]|nr:hypothetical protein CEY17_00625 [Corynebacterium glutamicum ATCC 14067]
MTTREDTHGCDYFTSIFLLPQLCNSTAVCIATPLNRVIRSVGQGFGDATRRAAEKMAAQLA